MTVRTLVLILVAAVTISAAPLGATDDPVPTFKSSVDLVPISAVVRDRRGRLVPNLGAADFEVFDAGVRRRILDFQVDRSGAVTLALLFDASGSMAVGPKLSFAKQVSESLVAGLADGRDEVGLFTFDAALHEQQPFTVHPGATDSGASFLVPFGTTSLYDAIAATARRLEARPAARRAIIVLTDGLDTSSELTPSEVSAIASSIEAPVYFVVAVPPIDRAQYMERLRRRDASSQASDLRTLARWTGGDIAFASAPEDAGPVASRIVSELRHQYLLAIESANASDWRRLEVRVRDQRLTVRARSGYFGRELMSGTDVAAGQRTDAPR